MAGEILQKQPDIVVVLGLVGGERNGALAIIERLHMPPQAGTGDPAQIVGGRLVRIDFQRAGEAGDRVLVSFGFETEHRAGIRRLERIRLEVQRLVEAQDRLVEALLLQQQVTHRSPDRGLVGIEHESAVKAPDRLLGAALAVQRGAEVGEIVGDVRILPDCNRKPLDGEVVLLAGHAEQAHQVQRIGVALVQRQRAAAAFLRFRELPGLEQPKARLEPGRGRLLAGGRC